MSTFQIFKDQENTSRNLKGGIATKENDQNRRAVLGLITNANSVRTQPQRAAKQAHFLKGGNKEAVLGLKKNDKKILTSKTSTTTTSAATTTVGSFSNIQRPFQIFEDKSKKITKTKTVAESKTISSINIKKETTIVTETAKAVIKEENHADLTLEINKVEITEEESQDTKISKHISNLRIPAHEEIKVEEKANTSQVLDMSIDSIIGSPLTVDKSQAIRKAKIQESLEQYLNVDCYDNDIYNYLKASEIRYKPKPGYMRKQPDITYSMRSILIDWLVEVADEYNLNAETLFLSVNYIDRFLSLMSVVRGKLQLVGAAAMFIAAKFEEIYPPDVNEFVYITDDTYKKHQVLKMEHLILKVLTFDISPPTILRFATKYNMFCKSSEEVKHLTQYICELSLLDGENFLQYLPSQIAMAAVAIARFNFNLESWPKEVEELTLTSLEDMRPVLTALNDLYINADKYPQQAVRDKFSNQKWSFISKKRPNRGSPLNQSENTDVNMSLVSTCSESSGIFSCSS